MIGSKKKPEVPAEEGAPAWMNTYGDMVTLLLTFFVLLFSFSTIDSKKWQEIVESFTGMSRVQAIAPLNPGEATVGGGVFNNINWAVEEEDEEPEEVKEQFDELYYRIRTHITDNGLDMQLDAFKIDNTIILRITDSALFDSGKDEIREDAKQILSKVAAIFIEYEEYISRIYIEGHTDNIPIHNAEFDSNWDLSTHRAVSVIKYLIDNTGIEAAKYTAAGYGEYHPIASNDTPEGRAKNRRVDFVIESILKDK